MPRRSRPRTVALPMAVTLVTLVGLTAVLTHPDEAITVTITGTTTLTNPPGSPVPKVYGVSGVSSSGRAIYKKVKEIDVGLVRRDEHPGSIEFRPWHDSPGLQTSVSFSYPGTPDDYRQSFSASVIPPLPVDETNLFLRVTPSDITGRRHGSVYVPVRRD